MIKTYFTCINIFHQCFCIIVNSYAYWSFEPRQPGWWIAIINLPGCVSFQLSAVIRIVVREEFSKDMADVLLVDMAKAVEHFEAKQGQVAKAPALQFSH